MNSKVRRSPRLKEKRDEDLKLAAKNNLWKKTNDTKTQKLCPTYKILNPESFRCIQRNGKLAKSLGIK